MKVLIAADIFPPAAGGPATYSVNLANELAKADSLFGVVSLTLNSDPSKINGKLWSVTNKNKFLRYAQYFWLLLKNSRPADIIYAMGPINAGLPAWLAARLSGKKFVVKIVGDYAWEQGQARFGVKDLMDQFQIKNGYGWQVWCLKKIESLVARSADQVIVPSRYLKKIVADWGVAVAKIEVIYNAVEFQDVTPVFKSEAEIWIATSGRLMPWKGADTLIEIMPDLIKAVPNIRLKVIGDGPVLTNLRILAKDLKVDSAVDFLGKLPRAHGLSIKAAADLFVLNSGYEGLSHELLEVFRLNVPIIASRVGGNPELVRDDGHLFEYNNKAEIKDKIIFYLSHPSAPSAINGSYTDFSFEVMVAHTKKVLQSICAN